MYTVSVHPALSAISRGTDPEVAGSLRPQDGAESPGCRGTESGENPHPVNPLVADGAQPGESAQIRRGNGAASHPHPA